MSREQYDPNSIDATLSRILTLQEAQDRKTDAILEQVTRTNGRVSALERFKEMLTAKITVIAAMVAALFSGLLWALKYYLSKWFG
jgi:hypothetical protein